MATKRTVVLELKTTGVNIEKQMAVASKSVTNLQTKFNNLGSKMSKIGGNLTKTMTLPILGLGVASVKLASDMEETLNKIDVSFGDNAKEVKEWAKTSIKSMGLAQQSALDTAALFGDMGTGMGQTSEEAAGMSTDLTKLSADLASFKNVRQDIAATALKSVYTGETESLKNLGIVMTQANLEAFAMSEGIEKNIKDMTQAEKVQLRYAFVMNATTKAQGDFERTGGGMANQSRMLTEQVKELGVEIGKKLLPVALKLVKWINKILKRLTKMSSKTKKTILIIAGLAAVIGPLILVFGKLFQMFSIISKAVTFLLPLLKVLFALIVANPIVAAIIAVIAIIIIFRKQIWEALKWIWEQFKKVFNFIADIIKKAVKAWVDLFKAYVNGIVAGLNFIKNVFIKVWKSIAAFFKNVWNGIINAFKTGGKIFVGIVGGIGKIFKGIINALIKGINWIISKPFKFINGILNRIRKISFLGISPFKNLWSANPLPIPKIPTLKVGTNIVNDEGMAMLHKGEAVVPANVMGGGFDTSQFVKNASFKDGSEKIVNITIPQTKSPVLDLDGTVIGNIILPEITKKVKLGGGNI